MDQIKQLQKKIKKWTTRVEKVKEKKTLKTRSDNALKPKIVESESILYPMPDYHIDKISMKELEKLLEVERLLNSVSVSDRRASLKINKGDGTESEVALIDSGCDTCAIGGSAWHITEKTGREVNITGHTEDLTSRNNIPVVSALTAVDLPTGEVILIKVNEASNLGENENTLLSVTQMRDHGVVVHDLATRHGGHPHIAADGYVIPLQLHGALMQFSIITPTRYELENSYQIELTSDMPWEPDRKSTRLNSSHMSESRMPSSA